MGRKARCLRRHRVGKVSYYRRHGSWHIYYRDGRRQVRRRAGDTEEAAAQVAAQVNAHLSRSCSGRCRSVPFQQWPPH